MSAAGEPRTPEFGRAFGKVMRGHPDADARLVNAILREAWVAARQPEPRLNRILTRLLEDGWITTPHPIADILDQAAAYEAAASEEREAPAD